MAVSCSFAFHKDRSFESLSYSCKCVPGPPCINLKPIVCKDWNVIGSAHARFPILIPLTVMGALNGGEAKAIMLGVFQGSTATNKPIHPNLVHIL